METSSFATLLRQCAKQKALCQGRRLHDQILASEEHSRDTYLKNLLIEMYGRCGSVKEAWLVFQDMEQPNTFSWNLIITACARNWHACAAKTLFDQAPLRDAVSWNALLAAYSQTGDCEAASRLFNLLPQRDGFSWNSIVSILARGGHVSEAKHLFHAMPSRDVLSWTSMVQALARNMKDAESVFERTPCWDVVCWNAMITVYGHHGHLEGVLCAFSVMPQRNAVTWNVAMHALIHSPHCHSQAKAVFCRMPQWDSAAWNAMVALDFDVFAQMPQRNQVSWNALIAAWSRNDSPWDALEALRRMPSWDLLSWNGVIAAFAAAGYLEMALSMFNKAPQRDIVSWNTMIAAFSDKGDTETSDLLFQSMPQHDIITWNSTVQAYASTGQIAKALMMYEKMGCFSLVACNIMIQAYSEQERVEDARRIFNGMAMRDEVSWNSIIAAYARKGDCYNAKLLFDGMQRRSVVSWNAMLHASCDDAAAFFLRMPSTSVASWNSMVQAYGVKGDMEQAKICFHSMPQRDVISWNGLISAHVGNKQWKDALNLLSWMDLHGTKPNMVTYLTLLDACAKLAHVAQGGMLHVELDSADMQLETRISTALINMYSKCAELDKAFSVFRGMNKRDMVLWTAMVAALAENGHARLAFELFRTMELQGHQPDSISFINVLSACSHAGNMQAGWTYFTSMIADHGIQPLFDHYACMLDLIARAGKLEDAYDLLEHMPFQPDPVTWMSVLSACRCQEQAARADLTNIVQPGGTDEDAFYVILAGIHTIA